MRLILAVLFIATMSLPLCSAGANEKKAPAAAEKDCDCCKEAVLKIGSVASSPSSVDVFRGMRYYFSRKGMPIELVLYSTYDGLAGNQGIARGPLATETAGQAVQGGQHAGKSRAIVGGSCCFAVSTEGEGRSHVISDLHPARVGLTDMDAATSIPFTMTRGYSS